MNNISIIIASMALLISASTFWLTRIKKGIVKMTRPTLICFVPENGGDSAKIFIRMLLYSTSEKGQYVQNMFVRLGKDESTKNFSIWAYGDKGLVRGSGLYVDKNGIGNYHHFLQPKSEDEYKFLHGEYNMQVFAETINNGTKKIFEQKLILPDFLQETGTAIYFDWESEKQNYYAHGDIGRGLPNLT